MAALKKKPVNPYSYSQTLHPDLLKALNRYLGDIREMRVPFVRRLITDHLTEKGYWPPKAKEPK